MIPNIQPKPHPAQLKAISSHPTTWYLEEESGSLSAPNVPLGDAESQKVSIHQAPPLQAMANNCPNARGNEHKLEPWRFHLNGRNVFGVRVMEHQSRPP